MEHGKAGGCLTLPLRREIIAGFFLWMDCGIIKIVCSMEEVGPRGDGTEAEYDAI